MTRRRADASREPPQLRLRAGIGALVVVAVLAAVRSLSPTPAVAQGEPLSATLVRAYESSPRLLEARERLRRANEERNVVLGGWLPNVVARGQVGSQKESFRNFEGNPQESTRLGNAGVEATINLYNGGGSTAELKRADNRIREERARFTSTEQLTLFDAAQAYCDLFRDQGILAARQANLDYLTRVVEVTRELYELGDRTEGDLAQASGRQAEAEGDLALARASLEGSRAGYVRAVGEPPPPIGTPTLPPGLPLTEENLLRESAEVNPDVVAADFAARAARNDIRVAVSQLLPSVDVRGLVDFTRDELRLSADRRVTTYSVVGVVTVPLYQQGIEYARVRQARAAARERDASINSVRRDVLDQASRAYSDALAAADRIEALGRAVEANQRAVASLAEEVRVGRRSLLDLLDAQRDLVNTQVSLASAQRDQVVAAYVVLGSFGRLTVRDLQLPVAFYDLQGDYVRSRNRLFGLD